LGLKIRDVAVRRSKIEQAKQASILPQIKATLDRDNSRDPIPPLGSAFYPEQGDLGLFGGAGGTVHGAQTFHFIEIRRVFLAVQGVGRLRAVLRAGSEHERNDLSPSWRSGEREPGDKLEVSRIGPW